MEAKTDQTGVFLVSTETRQTSKKPDLCSSLPVAHIFAFEDFYAKKCNLEPAIGEQKKPRPVANASFWDDIVFVASPCSPSFPVD
jgi:hypothetical protein